MSEVTQNIPHDPLHAAELGASALSKATGEAAIEHAEAFQVKLHDPVTDESAFGGQATILRADAVNAETGELSQERPVYFAGGYGGVKPAPYLVDLAKHGRNAFAVSLGGNRGSDRSFSAITQTEAGKVAEDLTLRQMPGVAKRPEDQQPDVIVSGQQKKKAATLLAEMAEQGIDQADAILQSESAIHGLLAAYAAPDKFKNIVLAYPAGINGQNTAGSILRSSIKHAMDVRRSRKVATNETSFIGDIGDNTSVDQETRTPGAATDAISVVFSEEAALLNAMRKKDDSPNVALVAGANDPIYPPDRYISELQSARDVNIIMVTNGKHGIGYDRETMDQVTGLLEAMESRIYDLSIPLRNRMFFVGNIAPDYAEKLYAMADAVDTSS